MKHVPSFAFVVLTSVWLAAVVGAAAPSALVTSQQVQESRPEDPAVGLMVLTCNRCHDSERILATRRTKSEWEETINNMIEKGATGSGREFETIFAYLLLNHGKIFINDADADEITKILGLSRRDADAVVAYRTANGSFAGVEALRKVPEIDLKTLDAHIEAVAF